MTVPHYITLHITLCRIIDCSTFALLSQVRFWHYKMVIKAQKLKFFAVNYKPTVGQYKRRLSVRNTGSDWLTDSIQGMTGLPVDN